VKSHILHVGALPPDCCTRIREWALGAADLREATVTSEGVVDPAIRRSRVSFPPAEGLHLQPVRALVAQARETYGIELGDEEEWQFTRYAGADAEYYGAHMDSHLDRTPEGKQDRKLSVIVQLSPAWDYSGGSVRLLGCDSPDPAGLRQLGSVLIFPSWVMHEVTPVITGTRYSLVGWMHGPDWR